MAEEAVRIKRLELIQKEEKPTGEYFSEISLSGFIEGLVNEYKKRGKAGYKHLITAKTNLEKFHEGTLIKEIDPDFCVSYFEWLKKGCETSTGKHLSEMTVHVYFRKFGLILTNAFRMGYLEEDVWKKVDRRLKGKEPVPEKRFLTLEELKILLTTPYNIEPLVRRAFLFSCFSGLRISDIRNLRWKDIEFKGDFPLISILMKKTNRLLIIPLNENCRLFLPPKGKMDKLIFDKLPSASRLQHHLAKWFEKAGLNGRITFHAARRTFATLLLTSGSDLYTISSLLGHTDIRMTQRYAKVVDRRKEEAVKLMDELMEKDI